MAEFDNLLSDSTNVDKKLSKQVTLARTYYDAQDLAMTCSQLSYFDSQVQKLPAKKATQPQRDNLIGQSQAIMGAIDCP